MSNILIVTKNQMMENFLKQFFEKEGYDCHSIREDSDVFKFIDTQSIDLLIVQATTKDSHQFIQSIQSFYPTLPLLAGCFLKREQIETVTTLTGRTPFRIPFDEEQLKEKVKAILH